MADDVAIQGEGLETLHLKVLRKISVVMTETARVTRRPRNLTTQPTNTALTGRAFPNTACKTHKTKFRTH